MSDKNNKHINSSFLMKRVYNDYIKKYYLTIIYALLMMIISSAATGFHAWLVQPALDDVLINSNKQMLIIIPLAVIVTTIIKGLATYIHTIKMSSIAHKVISEMQLKMFNKLMFVNLSYYVDSNSGNLISRLINDTNYLRIAIIKTITAIVKDSLVIIFLVINMFYQSWQLALFSFFAFPLAIWPIVKIGKKIRNVSYNTQDETGFFTNILNESIRGIRIIKAYCRQKFALKKADDTINKIKNYFIKSTKVSSSISPLMEFIGSLAVAVAIWGGGLLIINNDMTTGQFMSFLVSLLLAYKPVKSLGNLNINLQEGLAGAQRIFNLLDTEKSNIENNENKHNIIIKKGEIKLENISLSYDNENKVLDEFNIIIPSGKKVAIIGPTGSGKSSIINLILRFFDPQNGIVKIDEQDIKNFNVDSVREKISLVSQDTTLFNDTIGENIRFGNLDATFEDIKNASINAGANEFIEKLPEKFETLVGENGIKLSGGQKQRIAIARALIKNSPILLLDEATSSLDNITELEVQKEINNLMKNKTCLTVAHRLSTIENSDLIYVLDAGNIVQSGNHEKLIKEDGLYKKLYFQQNT
tara:strand:- start:794 stop:2551 length:1758 start_codon:yes stop_codon:yes gene_type:complete